MIEKFDARGSVASWLIEVSLVLECFFKARETSLLARARVVLNRSVVYTGVYVGLWEVSNGLNVNLLYRLWLAIVVG